MCYMTFKKEKKETTLIKPASGEEEIGKEDSNVSSFFLKMVTECS